VVEGEVQAKFMALEVAEDKAEGAAPTGASAEILDGISTPHDRANKSSLRT
jgi:hypothetical protein